jgi:hypothetical protein
MPGPDQLSSERIIGGAWQILGAPPVADNLMGEACEALVNALEQYSNLVAIHDTGRLLRKATFTTVAEQDEYLLADDLSLLRLLETDDPTVTPRVSVPVMNDLKDLDQWQAGAGTTLLTTGLSESLRSRVWPRRAAWYREGGLTRLRFSALPPAGIEFRYYYDPIGGGALALDERPDFPLGFVSLLKADVALRLAPRTGYAEPDYSRFRDEALRQRNESLQIFNQWLMRDAEEDAGVVAGAYDHWTRR